MTEKYEVLNMRWDYTGTRFACGPIEGDTITEVTFRNAEGKLYFVSASRMSEFFNVYVSDVQLFDILYWVADRDTNFEEELAKLEKYNKEFYSSELDEYDEIKASKYAEEMKLVLFANDYYCKHCDDEADAEEWLEMVIDGEIEATFPHRIDYDEENEEE